MVRVLPDVSGLDKAFDYLVPPTWAAPDSAVGRIPGSWGVGSLVRIDLHGRRVGGWVIDVDVDPAPDRTLREIRALSSVGPSAEVVALARWAAHRWHGRLAALLRTASPDRVVTSVGAAVRGPQSLQVRSGPTASAGGDHEPAGTAAFRASMVDALGAGGVSVVRVAPAVDLYPAIEAVVARGNGIVVTPDVGDARYLGGRLRRSGGLVSLAGRDWAAAATGGLVIGARSAVWATVADLSAIVVLDEHDERLQEERNPTWHARTVAVERARRLGIPCVLVSSAPSLDALHRADRVFEPTRAAERAGWPVLTIVDRRQEEPGTPGLFSSTVAQALRGHSGRVLCVLNRKGRAQMLACATCGELVKTVDGERLMAEVDGELLASTGERRPKVCARCGATKLKRLRIGVDRAREELAAMAGEPVGEITAETPAEEVERHRIVVGTEAVLHRINRARTVIFLDFDQELLAPRYRAAEQAMALLVRAARIVGGREAQPDARILVQTRSPDHRVLAAALRAEPSRSTDIELGLRQELGLPPFGALAEISGAGATPLLGPLIDSAVPSPISVLGPREDGRYLLRAPDSEILADVLDELPRPKARVRVAVDPPRV